MPSPTSDLGQREDVLDHLLGEDRAAGGDAADHRDEDRRLAARRVVGDRYARGGPPSACSPRRRQPHVDRARPVGVAAQEALALEHGQLVGDAGGRGQAGRLADLADARRVAAALDGVADDVEDRLLAAGQTGDRIGEFGDLRPARPAPATGSAVPPCAGLRAAAFAAVPEPVVFAVAPALLAGLSCATGGPPARVGMRVVSTLVIGSPSARRSPDRRTFSNICSNDTPSAMDFVRPPWYTFDQTFYRMLSSSTDRRPPYRSTHHVARHETSPSTSCPGSGPRAAASPGARRRAGPSRSPSAPRPLPAERRRCG